ncbi:helix-turn-helix transcriptional regulator [Streptomyces niveiscabiei]|uniref:helix-turn-helix domain-containing protein n=1 Tax=Streptomyces niveiscabiei TaxID=164115 RepID=UPI0029A7248F|nr:helix-turn-helix transcriptional regulator [Streptomyces niveiscabiei]MDX3387438.1 helix-turn-helix transcriptional regulator [Streptomyces niveiscabiei]
MVDIMWQWPGWYIEFVPARASEKWRVDGELGGMGAKKPRRNATAHKMVGAALAALRMKSGYTQAELAQAFGISLGSLTSYEQGRRPLPLDTAEQLDDFLETGGVLGRLVKHLPEVDLIALWADEFLRELTRALFISWFEVHVIPGLLQTDRYAHAIFRCRLPAFSEEKFAEAVADRAERRGILHRDEPPISTFVIWEPALRMPVGGREVWLEQLRYIRECCDLTNCTIQILPLDRPGHAGLDGPFVLLETPDNDRLAYMDSQKGNQLIADLKDIAVLTQRYGMLRSQALSPDETRAELDQMLGEQGL